MYLSNFLKNLQMLLINAKVFVELNWTKSCVITDNDNATTFQLTETEMFVPVVRLKTK